MEIVIFKRVVKRSSDTIAIRISKRNYEQLKHLAETSGHGIGDVADMIFDQAISMVKISESE